MNYNEAIEYIHSTYKFGSKLGLENISTLLKLMGNPEENLKFIHIAGTNGKGSTSSFISSILIEEGYDVGLFTSPYLEVFNERIRKNGKNIDDEKLAEITEFVKSKVDIMIKKGFSHPTEFEIVTAIAFEFYKRENVDFVVLEVGMGGRLDSTNVIKQPLVSVITPISLDHIEYLGDTLEKIAYEKAGIIKSDSVAVVHPQEEEALNVIVKKCEENNTKLVLAPTNTIEILEYTIEGIKFKVLSDEYIISVIGKYQPNNATLALTVINALKENYDIKVSKDAIKNGLKKAKWNGRFEVMGNSPTLIIDGAHNLHGIKGLKNSILELFPNKNIIGVVGILEDKDVSGMIGEIINVFNKVVVTEPNNPRKMKAEELYNKIEKIKHSSIELYKEENIKEAIDKSFNLALSEDIVVYFGSLYMIGEVRSLLKFLK